MGGDGRKMELKHHHEGTMVDTCSESTAACNTDPSEEQLPSAVHVAAENSPSIIVPAENVARECLFKVTWKDSASFQSHIPHAGLPCRKVPRNSHSHKPKLCRRPLAAAHRLHGLITEPLKALRSPPATVSTDNHRIIRRLDSETSRWQDNKLIIRMIKKTLPAIQMSRVNGSTDSFKENHCSTAKMDAQSQQCSKAKEIFRPDSLALK